MCIYLYIYILRLLILSYCCLVNYCCYHMLPLNMFAQDRLPHVLRPRLLGFLRTLGTLWQRWWILRAFRVVRLWGRRSFGAWRRGFFFLFVLAEGIARHVRREWLSRCEETVVRKLLSRLRRLFAMILFLLIITTFWRRTSFWRRMVHILSG